MIIDYGTARPPVTLLKQLWVTTVCRYIGWDGQPGYENIGKNISKVEADTLLANGISIVLAFEYAADASSNGGLQGAMDGALAKKQLAALGAPADMGVYFAVDFDIPDYAPHLLDTPANAFAKLGPVALYFQAINALKPLYEVNGYGGYYAIKRLLDAGLIKKGWQTIAWSGGQLDLRTVLYQNAAPLPAALQAYGADFDIREHSATVADFGQWPRPVAPTPTPVPTPIPQGVEMSYPMVLTPTHGLAYVLPIPAGKTKVILYADDLGAIPSAFRVGFGPAWSKIELSPTWDVPAVATIPSGESRITLSRTDMGDVPVTVDFA